MSDVVVTVVESNTNVTVTEQDVAVAVTETSVDVSTSTAGVQGATGATGAGYSDVTSVSTITIGSGLKTFTLVSGNQGAFLTGMRVRAIHSDTPTYYMEGTANYVGGGTLIITVDKFNGSGSHNSWLFAVSGEVGQTGATGSSGVVSVTSPITNTGTSGSAIVGIDQTLLSITQSQVTSLVTDLAGKASLGAANAFTVGGHVITNAATAVIPLVIKGASGQTADLISWQNSTGAAQASINSAGGFTGYGAHLMQSFVTTRIPLTIKGAASQSANLQEWQNSGGTALASISSAGALSVSSGNATISSAGVIRAVQVNTISDLATIREANSGGFLRMTRQTAALTNQGANIGGLYFRDGTTVGTLKLVVRAGAAGAETTILDNIPQ